MTGYKSNRLYFYKIRFRQFFIQQKRWQDLTLVLKPFFASSETDKRRVTGMSEGQTNFKGVHARQRPFLYQPPSSGLLQDFATKT
jgi:hypothetical protein